MDLLFLFYFIFKKMFLYSKVLLHLPHLSPKEPNIILLSNIFTTSHALAQPLHSKVLEIKSLSYMSNPLKLVIEFDF